MSLRGWRKGLNAGLLKSTDGGESWTLLGSWSSSVVEAVVRDILPVDTGSGEIVLLATDSTKTSGHQPGGLFRSVNRGLKFEQVSGDGSGLPYGNVSDLAVDPSNGNLVYAAVPGEGIFRSENAGAQWERIARKDKGQIAEVDSSLRIRLAVSVSIAVRKDTIFAARRGPAGAHSGFTQVLGPL